MDAIALLLDEFDTDDLLKKIDCLQNIKLIANYVGDESINSCIVPFLQSVQEKEKDCEVLRTLCFAWKEIAECFTDEENHLLILQNLQKLLTHEETIIRDNAFKTMIELFEKLTSDKQHHMLEHCFLPLLHQFLEAPNSFFIKKLEAIDLIAFLMNHSRDEDERSELLRRYCGFCEEAAEPVVRNKAIYVLPKMTAAVDKEAAILHILPIIETVWRDPLQDTSRPYVLASTLMLTKKCSRNEKYLHTFCYFLEASYDNSYRVRSKLAELLEEFILQFNEECFANELMQLFKRLASDKDKNFRVLAAQSFGMVVPSMKTPDLIEFGGQLLNELSNDEDSSVRAASCGMLCSIVKSLDPQLGVTNFFRFAMQLIGDVADDVRMSISNCIADFSLSLNMPLTENWMAALLMTLAKDTQWKVRCAVIQNIPLMLKQIEKPIYENEMHSRLKRTIEKLISDAMLDEIHAVRRSVIEGISEMAAYCGRDNTMNCIWPSLQRIYITSDVTGGSTTSYTHTKKAPQYLYKINVLHATKELAKAIHSTDVVDTIIPFVIEAFEDRIPNVRIVAVSAIAALLENHEIPSDVYGTMVAPALNKLLNDDDADVQYEVRLAFKMRGTEG